jgi:cytidyltransferase-like protein
VDLRKLVAELRSTQRPRLALWPERDLRPASVGLLAGSFDPITVGHVAMAEAAAARVDLVVLTYSVRTLPKEPGVAGPLLSEDERIRTVAGVSAGRPGMALGLTSHGLLVEQAAAAASRFPGAALLVVMGSDKLAQLFDPRWYPDRDAAVADLLEVAEVRYAVRSGDDVAGPLAKAERVGFAGRIRPLDVDPAVAAVSSRLVRQLAREGRGVSTLVPPEALDAVVRAAG